jgi:hypothetical protein
MLEPVHRLGPLKLAAITAALLVFAGAVVWALSLDGSSESTPETARNPVPSESADDDPGRRNRRGDHAAQASEPDGRADEDAEPTGEPDSRQALENLLPGGTGDPERDRSQSELPPKGEKPPGGSEGGYQAPPGLPPELRELLEGSLGGR